MIVTAWILFVVFGVIGLYILKFFFLQKNWLEAKILAFLAFSILVAAIAAGILFGGLKLPM
jgi:hypothetical protein